MANELGLYDPLFYAQEGLIALEKALGMAARVHRGYDKAPQQKGSTIKISRPSTFVAMAAPSTAQDIVAGEAEIKLDQHMEVKITLSDKQLTYTGEQIIEDHINPAAYAIALHIDQSLNALYKQVPWFKTNSSPAVAADITAVQRILFDNGVPEDDRRHLQLSGVQREELLNVAAFAQYTGAGDRGVETQLRGSLGMKYGFETFANQNVATHTGGVCADATGALVGAHAKGATSITVDAVTAAGTFKAGDTLVIAGNAQRYAIAADATADGAGAVTLTLTTGLVQAYLDNAVTTIDVTSGVQGLAFHRNAFALAMAPLSTLGGELGGAKIESVVNEKSRLALRARMFYMPDESRVVVALDALYGLAVLDGNQAVRLVDV